jgi:HK97 gp10 family phage protein
MDIKRGPNIEYRDNSDLIADALEKAINNGLTAIGMTAEGHAKRKITSYPAVDTGRLRNSITFAISGEKANTTTYTDNNKGVYNYSGTAPDDKEKAVYIGTNVEYGKHVELGTSKMAARPFLKPASTEHSEEYKRIMEAALKSAGL